jgi:O-antigen ligase
MSQNLARGQLAPLSSLMRLAPNLSPILGSDAFLFILAGVFLASVSLKSPYAAIFITLILVIFPSVLKDPLKVILLFLFVVPFTGTSYFSSSILPLPGAKPLQLLALFVTSIAILGYKHSVKMSRASFLFSVLVVTLFSVSVIRSVPHLDVINRVFPGEEILTPVKYLLSYLLKPLIYFIPFVFVVKFCKTPRDLERLVGILVVSLTVLSVYLVYSSLIEGRVGVEEANEYYDSLLGMRKNALADFYVVGFPIILAWYFLKKNIFAVFASCAAVVAIGFLYSRAAYVTLLFSTVVYLILSRRAKFLPVLVALALPMALLISTSIIERASKGLEEGSSDKFFAGRTEGLWLPLIEELELNPQELLLGNGRFAILTSYAAQSGALLEGISHPHNMYLELVLDGGICAFVILMSFLGYFLKRAYRNLRYLQDFTLKELQCAALVSLLSYFVAGIVGRSLFPDLSNSYFWVVLGLSIVITQISDKMQGRVYHGA